MPNSVQQEIVIQKADLLLGGILGLPENPKGTIIFAHGSGSGRYSPRNQFVANELQKAGLATLLMDLFTEEEALSRQNVFDINLLSSRLQIAKAWLTEYYPELAIKIGYFGASTGAGAALVAAAADPAQIFAVVSRGGRPDLAADWLPQVKAPTLLIVGGRDEVVIDLNQLAFEQLNCVKKLEIVPGATHLFEETGTLEQVAVLAQHWFSAYLA